MFYRLTSDIYAAAGILEEPNIPGFHETFMTGARLREQPPTPLVFRSNFDRDDPPRGFEGMSIPVWSSDLVELFQNIGIDNFELYDAVIEGEAGAKWTAYFAVNIVGTIAAADLSKSRFTEILSTPGGLPVVFFDELVIDGKRVGSFDLFRLAENSEVVVSERVMEALRSNPRSGGWGISAFPIVES